MYEVSDTGIVRSVERDIVKSNGITQHRKARILSQHLNSDGYYITKLSANGQSKHYGVHQLVALAFIDKPCDNLEINHIDCNRKNNCVANIEWVTHSENVKYAKKLGRHISDRGFSGRNNPNYGNNKLSKLYKENPELTIVQSRPGNKNGRARPIRIIGNGINRTFGYIRECSIFLIENKLVKCKNIDYISTKIRKAAELGKDMCGYKLELL